MQSSTFFRHTASARSSRWSLDIKLGDRVAGLDQFVPGRTVKLPPRISRARLSLASALSNSRSLTYAWPRLTRSDRGCYDCRRPSSSRRSARAFSPSLTAVLLSPVAHKKGG